MAFGEFFFMRDTAGSPEGARWLHLARSGSQSQRAIWFILPAQGASHIIIQDIMSFYFLSCPVHIRLSRVRSTNTGW